MISSPNKAAAVENDLDVVCPVVGELKSNYQQFLLLVISLAALAHSEDILQQQSQSVQKIYIIILLMKEKTTCSARADMKCQPKYA
jgi:hypothetical protein